jgi:hypothetical protein
MWPVAVALVALGLDERSKIAGNPKGLDQTKDC